MVVLPGETVTEARVREGTADPSELEGDTGSRKGSGETSREFQQRRAREFKQERQAAGRFGGPSALQTASQTISVASAPGVVGFTPGQQSIVPQAPSAVSGSFTRAVAGQQRREREQLAREKRAGDIFRAIPGLRGDRFVQRGIRAQLSLPVTATVGLGAAIVGIGEKVVLAGRGLSRKETRAATGAEIIRAGKATPAIVKKTVTSPEFLFTAPLIVAAPAILKKAKIQVARTTKIKPADTFVISKQLTKVKQPGGPTVSTFRSQAVSRFKVGRFGKKTQFTAATATTEVSRLKVPIRKTINIQVGKQKVPIQVTRQVKATFAQSRLRPITIGKKGQFITAKKPTIVQSVTKVKGKTFRGEARVTPPKGKTTVVPFVGERLRGGIAFELSKAGKGVSRTISKTILLKKAKGPSGVTSVQAGRGFTLFKRTPTVVKPKPVAFAPTFGAALGKITQKLGVKQVRTGIVTAAQAAPVSRVVLKPSVAPSRFAGTGQFERTEEEQLFTPQPQFTPLPAEVTEPPALRLVPPIQVQEPRTALAFAPPRTSQATQPRFDRPVIEVPDVPGPIPRPRTITETEIVPKDPFGTFFPLGQTTGFGPRGGFGFIFAPFGGGGRGRGGPGSLRRKGTTAFKPSLIGASFPKVFKPITRKKAKKLFVTGVGVRPLVLGGAKVDKL